MIAPDLEFTVFGIPAPKGSKRGFVVGSRAVVVDDNKPALRDWTRSVNDVVIDFFLPKPASAPKRRRTWPMRKPDLDKLTRAMLDPLVKVRLIADDARIVELRVSKDYASGGDRPRAEVRVWTLARLNPETENGGSAS
jgi:crossover junction endodeoxyribonuclease RusA